MPRKLTIIKSETEFDQRFWIDVPVKTVMEDDKLLRMEIPAELARYIWQLQNNIIELKNKLEEK